MVLGNPKLVTIDTRAPSPSAQRCLDNAAHCDRVSRAAQDWDVNAAFAAAADHWRNLAQYDERLAADQRFNARKLLDTSPPEEK